MEKNLPVEKSGPCLDQATGIAVEEMQTATQPLEAPGAGIATQPVQAPGSFPEVQPTSDEAVSAASDSEDERLSTTGSLDGDIHQDRSADRDASRDDQDSLVSWTVSIETDPRAGGVSPPGTFPWSCTS